MTRDARFASSLFFAVVLIACSVSASFAQSSLTTIDNPGGGRIVYGVVDGATSPSEAMISVLRMVQKTCREKPQVGKVFRVRGTNSHAVFFSVVDHSKGNKEVAGMLIAAPSGPGQIEVALMTDDAARFGSTVNPMLNRLFSQWHPGGQEQVSGGPASGGKSAPPQPLRRVANQDGSASVAIPAGWKIQGNGGTTLVIEPHYNAMVNINLVRGATSSYPRYPHGPDTGMGAKMVFPSNADPIRAFPGLIKEFYRVNNQNIVYRIAHIEQIAAPRGQRCVHSFGHGVIFSANRAQPPVPEKDFWEMEMLLCTTATNGMGEYTVTLSISEVDPRFAARERATLAAILSSYQVNAAVVAGQAGAIAAPAIDAIHRVGAAATARMERIDKANEAQHAGYYARQDANARRSQGFSNYLLDQSVIQDNNVNGRGTIGHGTVWNSTADALVKANPNRYEIVDNPNFWKNWDYR